MAEPVNNIQQPLGLSVNATLRTKEGFYIKAIKFDNTVCKFLVLRSTYNSGTNPKQDCFLTANVAKQGITSGISLHIFDALNAPTWKIDDWSKAVKTGLNLNKLRKPTEDELALINAIKKNETDEGLQVFWKNPMVVEAAFSINNPKTGTNSANKQNQIDNGLGSKPKQPNAAVQGAIEGMSEKNPALESVTNIVFDRIIRESSIEDDLYAIENGGWDAFRDDEYDNPYLSKSIHQAAQEAGMSDLDYVNEQEKYEELYEEDEFIADLEEYGLEKDCIDYYLDDDLNDIHRPLKDQLEDLINDDEFIQYGVDIPSKLKVDIEYNIYEISDGKCRSLDDMLSRLEKYKNDKRTPLCSALYNVLSKVKDELRVLN